MNKIIASTIFLGFSFASLAQTSSNTYPYPSFGKVGIGTTNLLNYNLTTASDLFYKIVPGEEENTYESGVVPFRILAQDYDPEAPIVEEASNVDFLSEARIYDFGQPASSNTRVYGLKRDGSMLLGEWANSSYHSFAYSLVTDNSIYTKNNLYVENRIGLGTTNPQAAIDVKNGAIALNGNRLNLVPASDGNHFLQYNYNFGGITLDGPTLVGYTGGVLGTTNGTTKGVLFWNKNGRVGINVASPTNSLEVMGNVKFDGPNTNDELVSKSFSGYRSLEFHELRFHEWGVGNVFNLNNGRIGINTITPSEVLDVNGNIKAKIIRSVVSPTSNALVVENSSSNGIDFLVKGDGRVFAREVEVKMGVFPDYVFEEDYKLMKLDELRNFIEKENHLPKIKSAKKIAEEGIGLGELSKMQMEKIEELTLYILQLEERVKKLENQ